MNPDHFCCTILCPHTSSLTLNQFALVHLSTGVGSQVQQDIKVSLSLAMLSTSPCRTGGALQLAWMPHPSSDSCSSKSFNHLAQIPLLCEHMMANDGTVTLKSDHFFIFCKLLHLKVVTLVPNAPSWQSLELFFVFVSSFGLFLMKPSADAPSILDSVKLCFAKLGALWKMWHSFPH